MPRAALAALLWFALPVVAGDLAVNGYVPFPVGSPRVMGMAGAFTGIGTGAESLLANPAAVVRPKGFTWGKAEIDYMLSFAGQNDEYHSDFGNVGPALLGTEAVTLGGVGLISRFNREGRCPLGYGITVFAESYEFTDGGGGQAKFSLVSPRLSFGRTYLDEQLAVSFSVHPSSPNLEYLPPGEIVPITVEYEGFAGVPFGLGVLWAPEDAKFRIGLRLSGQHNLKATGPAPPGIDPFPSEVIFPGEWALGASFRLGEPAPDGVGEWFDTSVVGIDFKGVFPVSGTTGFERFRSVAPLEIGPSLLFQPGMGVETELFSRIAWIWSGTYYEPARYSDVEGRLHVTGGFRLRFLKFKTWGLYLNVAADVAQRYEVYSVSVSTGG